MDRQNCTEKKCDALFVSYTNSCPKIAVPRNNSMSYKTILLHVDDSEHFDERMRVAAKIAAVEKAHLIGAAMTGIPKGIVEPWTSGPGGIDVSAYVDTVNLQAEIALQHFDSMFQQLGVTSFERLLVDDDAPGGVNELAHYCELVVLGQYDPEDNPSPITSDLAEYVAMNGGSPVLVVPYSGQFKTVGERVLIAWNGSPQATRAVRGAIPLLQRSSKVDIVIFRGGGDSDRGAVLMEQLIASYLARHSIQANVTRQPYDANSENDIGNLLLSMIADLSSDLLVMGCYGHSRSREILLGGATRTIMKSMTVPVLMAH